MSTLADRVAIVTGASGGIGHAIATRFVEEGAIVVPASRSSGTDVTKVGMVDALVDAVVTEHGRLDIIVNNAGIQLEKTIAETTDDDFDDVFAVNVRGLFNCCRAAVRVMCTRGGGNIINIGSISAGHADPTMAVYNASKAAVHALTRSIAIDHGSEGIRCNAIAPGWIATAMADAGFARAPDPVQARESAIARHPVGRLGLPEDVAGLAAWLAGPESAFVTGAIFTIDGGLTAQSPI